MNTTKPESLTKLTSALQDLTESEKARKPEIKPDTLREVENSATEVLNKYFSGYRVKAGDGLLNLVLAALLPPYQSRDEWKERAMGAELLIPASKLALETAVNNINALTQERDQLKAQCDVEMLRLKACEHIAEGEQGWEQVRHECPSTEAVACLRDKFQQSEAAGAEMRLALQIVTACGAQCDGCHVTAKEAIKSTCGQSILAELQRLRAIFPQILSALKNGSGCSPDCSIEFFEGIPKEVELVVGNLKIQVAQTIQDVIRGHADNVTKSAIEAWKSIAEANKRELKASQDRVRELEAGLKKLGSHSANCEYLDFPLGTKPCNCGFRTLLTPPTESEAGK